MDFEVRDVGALRFGRTVWSKGELKKEICFPGCILSTNAGSVPHLTTETYSYIPKQFRPNVAKIPLLSVIDHEEMISEYPGSMSELFNLGSPSVTMVTTKDSLPRTRGKPCPTLNTIKAVSVWGNSGRIMVDPARHIELMSKLEPDVFEILGDSDTAMENASKKRISKSFANSVKFLEDSLSILKKRSELKDSLLIPPLQGGNSTELRKRYTTSALKLLGDHRQYLYKFETFPSLTPSYVASVDKTIGFSVEGIDCEHSDYIDLVKASVADLPKNKLRFVPGPQSPRRVFELLEAGIDIFDTSYPIILAQNNKAIVFPIPGTSNSGNPGPDVLDLSDDANRLAFEPLLAGCTCYACQNHTRAYLYHLIAVNELLAPILLTLHNLQHYLAFFERVRLAVASGEYEKFKAETLRATVFT